MTIRARKQHLLLALPTWVSMLDPGNLPHGEPRSWEQAEGCVRDAPARTCEGPLSAFTPGKQGPHRLLRRQDIKLMGQHKALLLCLLSFGSESSYFPQKYLP